MKYILQFSLSLAFSMFFGSLFAQLQRINPHTYESHSNIPKTDWFPAEDPNYDVHFYHIKTEVAIDSVWMSGKVKILISSNIDDLSSILIDLDQTFDIENISSAVSDYSFSDNVIQLNFENTYNTGDTLSFTIEYRGYPEMPGGYKGLRYETHDGNEPIIATLSTPYLAHSWYPCKDGTSDKADSVFVDITIKDTVISDIPIIAISNGILENTYTEGNMKTFEWRHRYPVVPYYVMMAISNYAQFQQQFDDGENTFPIDYYVFESHLETAQLGVEDMPTAMALFAELFGPYPFKDEKCGMTQLGYYGAIENQTNTIINNMSEDWITTSVHELAHMWFADDITCETWNHGWVNEGFASYAEALFIEHTSGIEAYHDYVQLFSFKQGGTVYLDDVSDPFNGVFQSIIYNKGAYILHMLRGVLGDDVFFDCLYEYASSEELRHGWSNTEVFQDVCEEVSGEDLEYFFHQWVYEERYPKYRYNFVSSANQTEVILQQSQGLLGWLDLFIMPVKIRFQFNDGTDSTIQVFNNEIEAHYSFDFGKEVLDVEIDPEKWILRDVAFDDDIPVGLPKIETSSFKIFPNPNNGSFQVLFSHENQEKPSRVRLYNSKGQMIRELKIYTSSIELNSLEKGVYLLEIETARGRIIEKLVIY